MTTPKAAPRLSANTVIDADKTEAEIKKYLKSRGVAPPILLTEDPDNRRILLAFRLYGRDILVEQRLPDVSSKYINRNGTGGVGQRPPSSDQVMQRMEAETRRRWRVLLAHVKLRLDLVFDEQDEEERERMFHDEFVGDTRTADGSTVREWVQPQLAEAYAVGRPIQMLPQPAPYKQLERR